MALNYDIDTKVITANEVVRPKIHPGGLGCLLFENINENKNNVAQIQAETGETVIYSTFLQKCIRTAIEMKNRGLQPGDIISICSYNHLNSTVPYVAAIFLGVKIAPLDPSLSVEDTKHLLKIVEPKMVFVSTNAELLIEQSIGDVNTEIVVFGATVNNCCFDDFLGVKENEAGFQPLPVNDIEETVLILFSSGTTGMPKGICLSHKFVIYCCMRKFHKIVLGLATMYWLSCNFYILSSMINGTCRLLTKNFDPQLIWEYLHKYHVDYMVMAPCDAITFYRNRPDSFDLPHLRTFTIGGSPISRDYLQKIVDCFPNVVVAFGYGLTELFGVFNPIHPSATGKLGCVGAPLPGRIFKITNPETEENLGFNQSGELRVKSEWCMSGYHNQDTSEAFDAEGFIKTGDIAYYDEEFCFYVVDRIKEMFKYKSWHILPAKLERILLNHPGVEFAAVVGIPHEDDDNHALAVVQPFKNNTATEEELQRFVNEQVDDRHKLRGGVRFVQVMPITPSGKIKRRELRDRFINCTS